MTKTKDFTQPEYSNPIMDMWEFFEENPQYMLLKYEHVSKGGQSVLYGGELRKAPKGFFNNTKILITKSPLVGDLHPIRCLQLFFGIF